MIRIHVIIKKFQRTNTRYPSITTLILRSIFETDKINRAEGKSNFENIGETRFPWNPVAISASNQPYVARGSVGQPEAVSRLTRELYFQPACATYVTGSVNASWGTRVYVPAGSYAVRVCACSGRTHRGKVQARLEASVKGPRPTRFTTLSCNYHHKVDFTTSKSPRKGMLHFVDPSPRPWAPFSTTLGLRHLRGNHLGLLSAALCYAFTLRPTRSILSIPRDLTLRPHRER